MECSNIQRPFEQFSGFKWPLFHPYIYRLKMAFSFEHSNGVQMIRPSRELPIENELFV